jgi:hypothetical protein
MHWFRPELSAATYLDGMSICHQLDFCTNVTVTLNKLVVNVSAQLAQDIQDLARHAWRMDAFDSAFWTIETYLLCIDYISSSGTTRTDTKRQFRSSLI